MDIKEVIEMGEQTLRSLKYARDYVGGTSEWGVKEVIGGGFVSAMVERTRVSVTKRDLEKTKSDMRAFCEGLRQLGDKTDSRTFIEFGEDFADTLSVDSIEKNDLIAVRDKVDEAVRKTEKIVKLLSKTA